MSGQRLYAMLCVRARPEVREKLGKKLKRGGTLNDDAAYTIITYPTVSGAVAAVAALFASEPKAQEARFCLGVVEARSQALNGRIPNILRSLADQCSPGQVLLTSAAREIIRGLLPSKSTLTKLGDVMIATEISSELVWQFTSPHINADFPPLPGLYEYRSNVPQSDSFLGREREAAGLAGIVSPSRLVNVVGPVGVGKTALMRYVAGVSAESFKDGAIWIDATTLEPKANVYEFVSSQLGVGHAPGYTPQLRLIERLRGANLLVCIDGCDTHLGEWAGLISLVHDECQDVCVITTSRYPEQLPLGHDFVVEPFYVPLEELSIEELERLTSIRFFLNIAGVPPTAAWLKVALHVVRRVEGIPLAIELLAGQVRSERLDVGEFRSLLEEVVVVNSLEGLTTIALHGLDPEDLDVLTQLSVLRGSWTKEFALQFLRNITPDEKSINRSFDRLLRRRLILHEPGSYGYRHHVLRPIRSYLSEKVRSTSDYNCLMQVYARSAIDFAKRETDSSRIDFDTIGREYSHVRVACEHFLPMGGSEARQLTLDMLGYWLRRGPYDEGLALTKLFLNATAAATEDRGVAAKTAGTLAGYAGNYVECADLLLQAAEIWSNLGFSLKEAGCLLNLAIHTRNNGNLPQALAYAENALKLCGEEPSIERARALTGCVAYLSELQRWPECLKMLPLAEEAIHLAEDRWARGGLCFSKSTISLGLGNTENAIHELIESMDGYAGAGDMQGLLCAIERMAFIALRLGQVQRAAKLLGGTSEHFHVLGIVRAKDLLQEKHEALEHIGENLSEEVGQAIFEEGAKLRIDELVQYARET